MLPASFFQMCNKKKKGDTFHLRYFSIIKWVMDQRGTVLTQIIGNFVCAIRKHPEKHSVSAADRLASFIHPGCYEHTTGVNALHEDVTSDCEVPPGTNSVKLDLAWLRSGCLLTGRVVLLTSTHHWWSPMTLTAWSASVAHVTGRWVRTCRKVKTWGPGSVMLM